ncbi:MAG: glycosyltransferase [Planctomycetales bacterium]|nr:glycosyltransferase [Planctomycetales bacterium]
MSGQDAGIVELSVTCFIHSLAGGGAERVMAGLTSRLSQRGHSVTLVTLDDGSGDRHQIDPAVRRVTLNLSSDAVGPLGKFRQVRQRHQAIATTIRAHMPDVVLSFCDRMNIDVLLSSHRLGPPIVVSERSDPARQSLGWFWDLLRKRSYPHASAVVALTEASAAYLRPFSHRVEVIPSAVDTPTVCSHRDQAIGRKLIVGAGRLEAEKGFDRLLEAFAKATEFDPSWQLVIYGEGSLRDQLTRQAQMLQIADRFQLPGWMRPLSESLAQATLFCLPSQYEGFPSVLLEAMSLGVPSISVDCESGPRVIVDHGRNGLLVEPSIEGLCEGISRMISSPAEREKLGRAGTGIVEQFGWPAMVDRYESLLSDVARRHRDWTNTLSESFNH